MGPRTELVLALVAAVLIMGQFASLVEGCALTDVGGVQTLVVGSDITKIQDNLCQNNYAILAVDFSQAISLTEIGKNAFKGSTLTAVDFSQLTSLTKIGDYAFQGATGLAGTVDLTQATSLTEIGDFAFQNTIIAEKVDLSGLQNLVKIGRDAFASTKMTSFDISNCEKLGYIGISGFSNNPNLESFVAKNVGTKSKQEDYGYSAGCDSFNGEFSGALMFGYWGFGACPKLASFDFRGTAVGTAELYYNCWAYADRSWGFEETHDVFYNTWGSMLSYESTALNCSDAKSNDFGAKTGKPQHTYTVGGIITVGQAIPDPNPNPCTRCAANCDSCDTADEDKCDTCSPGYIKTDDDTCEDINGCAGNITCTTGTCADVEAPGTGYECKGKCSDLDLTDCEPEQVLSDTLFCQDAPCTADVDKATCCVPRANCSTITCAAGTENKTSAASKLCDGATCDSATADNELCCQDTNGCIDSPDCGTNATCADVTAPGTGHECRCDDGFTGTTTTGDTAATCTPVQLGGAALPSTSSAAVWIVSSIFASVFAVSSSGA